MNILRTVVKPVFEPAPPRLEPFQVPKSAEGLRRREAARIAGLSSRLSSPETSHKNGLSLSYGKIIVVTRIWGRNPRNPSYLRAGEGLRMGQNFEVRMTVHEVFGVISVAVAIAGLFGPILMLLK
jgi:hypothetical protein